MAVDEQQHTVSDLSEPTRGFLAELTHAMQAAAEHQREATASEVEATTRAHLERVRARAGAEAEELRHMAQGDIDGIHAWQQAESRRIQEEAERRILARGQELDVYLVRHAAIIDGEVEHVEGAVANYQTRLDEYFDRLTIETSPAEIARLADEMPEPPDLTKVGGEARAQAVAALAVESGDAAASGADRSGPGVPVMAEPIAAADGSNGVNGSSGTATTNGATSNGSTSNGANDADGSTQEHANPAMRILRSIATLAAPPEHPAEAAKATEPEDAAKV